MVGRDLGRMGQAMVMSAKNRADSFPPGIHTICVFIVSAWGPLDLALSAIGSAQNDETFYKPSPSPDLCRCFLQV